jgi:hypothetical protein
MSLTVTVYDRPKILFLPCLSGPVPSFQRRLACEFTELTIKVRKIDFAYIELSDSLVQTVPYLDFDLIATAA